MTEVMTTWRSSITEAAQSVTDGNVTKESVDDAIGEMKDATDKLTNDLQDLGAPDTEAGEQAKEQADKLSALDTSAVAEGDALDRQLSAISQKSEVDAALDALKARMGEAPAKEGG